MATVSKADVLAAKRIAEAAVSRGLDADSIRWATYAALKAAGYTTTEAKAGVERILGADAYTHPASIMKLPWVAKLSSTTSSAVRGAPANPNGGRPPATVTTTNNGLGMIPGVPSTTAGQPTTPGIGGSNNVGQVVVPNPGTGLPPVPPGSNNAPPPGMPGANNGQPGTNNGSTPGTPGTTPPPPTGTNNGTGSGPPAPADVLAQFAAWYTSQPQYQLMAGPLGAQENQLSAQYGWNPVYKKNADGSNLVDKLGLPVIDHWAQASSQEDPYSVASLLGKQLGQASQGWQDAANQRGILFSGSQVARQGGAANEYQQSLFKALNDLQSQYNNLEQQRATTLYNMYGDYVKQLPAGGLGTPAPVTTPTGPTNNAGQTTTPTTPVTPGSTNNAGQTAPPPPPVAPVAPPTANNGAAPLVSTVTPTNLPAPGANNGAALNPAQLLANAYTAPTMTQPAGSSLPRLPGLKPPVRRIAGPGSTIIRIAGTH